MMGQNWLDLEKPSPNPIKNSWVGLDFSYLVVKPNSIQL